MDKKNKVKLLIILRLFTGLEKSIIKKKWEPTGVPTIYKFLEKVDKVFHCRIIFIAFGDNELNLSNYNKKINVDGLNSDIYLFNNNILKKNIISKIKEWFVLKTYPLKVDIIQKKVGCRKHVQKIVY